MAGFCAFVLAFTQCFPNNRQLAADICSTPHCVAAAEMMSINMNVHQEACLDFYERACGNFNTQIVVRRNQFMSDIAKDNLDQQIVELLNVQDDLAQLVIKNARAAYRHCLDTSRQSTAPIDCIEPIKGQYPRALLYLLATPEIYAEREKVLKIGQYVQRSFIQTIQKSWLDDDIKAAAVDKLYDLTIMIGFTSQMILPENLHKPYTSVYNLFGTSCEFDSDHNVLFVPMAALGYPINQLGLEALNFAGIGFAIARQMSRKFDIVGKRNGYQWPNNIQQIFLQKTKCFEKQYNMFPVHNLKTGTSTLDEIIRDNVGFQLTLDAYRLYVGENDVQKKLINFDEYSDEKLFTLALANEYCENVSPQLQIKRMRVGQAPARNRINGMMMNSIDFGNLWNCPVNLPMNPVDKCNVWINNDQNRNP